MVTKAGGAVKPALESEVTYHGSRWTNILPKRMTG